MKIKELIKSIKENPFKGLGKPELLKHGLKGFWSRRITGEHRLVFKVSGKKRFDQRCTIIQCRFHYDDK
ncbi:Txe/YoeB family addiction module toxin [Autumnicola edwardsiae]|uniref:Putative mRNA interferase YoeB n=1 Tax=Autumnicola edwardsiae TaxID=3075594 RepID=A0ABU3CXG0_9FLAO|nr:Txe/YoeB family addiction module toxin [Zunongwangia sp. F297]MDT0651045.1 Txe/YoeB family addiction module toxin [Zunongwangia sp. F297]